MERLPFFTDMIYHSFIIYPAGVSLLQSYYNLNCLSGMSFSHLTVILIPSCEKVNRKLALF